MLFGSTRMMEHVVSKFCTSALFGVFDVLFKTVILTDLFGMFVISP